MNLFCQPSPLLNPLPGISEFYPIFYIPPVDPPGYPEGFTCPLGASDETHLLDETGATVLGEDGGLILSEEAIEVTGAENLVLDEMGLPLLTETAEVVIQE